MPQNPATTTFPATHPPLSSFSVLCFPFTNQPGGLLSGALFQYPGAIIMSAVGVFAADPLVDPKGALAGVASGAQERF